MDPKFLLAIMLLLQAPTVFGCVKFYAQYHPGATIGDPEPLQMYLNDNDVNQCNYDGLPNQPDSVSYGLTCLSGVSAVFNPTLNDNQGGVTYSPPWGPFYFGTDYTPADDNNNPGSYSAWVYGC